MAPVPRSNFVTGLAWVHIVCGALGVLVALFQVIVFYIYLPMITGSAEIDSEVAGVQVFPLLRAMSLLALGFWIFVVLASVALLQRREWARIAFIVMFVLGVVFNVLAALGAGMGMSMGGELLAAMYGSNPAMQAMMGGMMSVLLGLTIVGTLVLVWLVYRLCTEKIIAEFRPAA